MFDQSINYIVIKLKTLFHSPRTEHCCFISTRDLVSGRDNIVDIGPGSEVRQVGVVFHPGQFNQRYYPQVREHKQIPSCREHGGDDGHVLHDSVSLVVSLLCTVSISVCS